MSPPPWRLRVLSVLDPRVTFLVGDNGSGKSTLVEAVAIKAGLNPEGGSMNLRFRTRPSESALHSSMDCVGAPVE